MYICSRAKFRPIYITVQSVADSPQSRYHHSIPITYSKLLYQRLHRQIMRDTCIDVAVYNRTSICTETPLVMPSARRGCLLRYFVVAVVLLVLVSSSGGRAQRTCVSQPIDGVCEPDQYYDSTESCCIQCTDCSNSFSQDHYQSAPCNGTRDTVCVPLCPEFHFWSTLLAACVIDCASCPGGRCHLGTTACVCDSCHEGVDCSIVRDECINEPDPVEPEMEKEGN